MKENILFLTIDAPIPTTGGSVLDFENIKFLSKHFNVHLFFLNPNIDKTYTKKDLKQLEKYTKNIHTIEREKENKLLRRMKILSSPKPRLCSITNQKENSKVIKEYSQKNNITKAFLMSIWSSILIDMKDDRIEKFGLLVNVEHEIFQTRRLGLIKNLFNKLEKIKTKRFEKKVIESFDKVATLTQKDEEIIRSFANQKNIETIPPIMKPIEIKKVESPPNILITTNLKHDPNIVSTRWFFEEVYPKIDKKITINITGLDSKNHYLQKLAVNKNINYHGFVSKEELDNLYSKTTASVNPTIAGSGFQIKTLDSLARNIPIISTEFSNHLGSLIKSSDNPETLANLINNSAKSKNTQEFDYSKFYQENTKKLLDFISN